MAGKAAPKKNLSALKRVRQSEKLNMRNQSRKAEIKTLEKKFESVSSKEEAEKQLKTIVKSIAGAASKGIIHKNTASRKISKLARRANAIAQKA